MCQSNLFAVSSDLSLVVRGGRSTGAVLRAYADGAGGAGGVSRSNTPVRETESWWCCARIGPRGPTTAGPPGMATLSVTDFH